MQEQRYNPPVTAPRLASYYRGLYEAAKAIPAGLNRFQVPTPPIGTLKYRPHLIRVVVDVTDPQGNLAEPLSQEYIFPVRIRNSY
jgi:hypothetical protein